MLSDLECSIRDTAESLRGSSFAQELRDRAPGRRLASGSGPAGIGLADFELNLGIPIQRTIHVLEQARAASYQLRLTEDDREYVRWISVVHQFLRAVGDRFWRGIPESIRSVFFDGDNVPAFATTFIPALRDPHPPDLRATADQVGLSTADLSRLGEVWGATRSTAAWSDAVQAASEVRKNSNVYRRIRERNRELRSRIWGRPDQPTTVGDYASWIRAAVDETFANDHPTERRLRAYNHLTQVALECLLGLLEQYPDNSVIRQLTGPIAVRHFKRDFGVRLIVAQGSFIHPGAPFVIEANGPLDGVYQCTAFSFQGVGSTHSIVDYQGRRLADLEEASD
jgi:hypothetical protein